MSSYLVIVRKFEHMNARYYNILSSYVILHSKFIQLINDKLSVSMLQQHNIIVHIDTEENIQAALRIIPSNIRYFGYVNVTERIVTNCVAYIGIPISLHDLNNVPTPSGMWDVVYPHITLTPPQNDLKEYCSIVGQRIEFNVCKDSIRTPNTISYSVLIQDEEYYITCCVSNGKTPSIAKKEMVGKRGKEYVSCLGYPVIM
jgi:hypothetical protein